MKNWLIGALVVALCATTVPGVSEAKRLGAGRSSGMQRDMPARTAPDAAPAKPATPPAAAPQQAAPAAPAAPQPGAPAAAPKRSWMGPIAGLAAGLGIAALMSHFGMGEAFGNFLMLALLAVAGIALVAFLMRRFGAAKGPALAGAGAGAAGGNTLRRIDPAPVAWPPEPVNERTSPAIGPLAAVPVTRAFVPAAFDSEGFERTAKLIFIRMQAANDAADLDDLRRFTTPEFFAEARLEIQERGNAAQQTDVREVHAQVLDVANEAERQIVSVRFSGQIVEEAGAAPVAFNEVWHLVKPHDDSRPWVIAGIEQAH